jgi:hypothetical protein
MNGIEMTTEWAEIKISLCCPRLHFSPVRADRPHSDRAAKRPGEVDRARLGQIDQSARRSEPMLSDQKVSSFPLIAENGCDPRELFPPYSRGRGYSVELGWRIRTVDDTIDRCACAVVR